MAELRLSEEGFKVIMENMQANEAFRKQFLLGDLSRSPISLNRLSASDLGCLAALKWETRSLPDIPIDEKIVLCSSSGY